MKFQSELSGESFTIELDQNEAELLHSILEWAHRCSKMKDFKGKVSEDEVKLAGKISSDMVDYLYPQE